VAANASLATGSSVYSLQLLADGHLAAGTDWNGVQLFANVIVASALLDSRKEVAAIASLATASAANSLRLLAGGHLAVGTDGVQLFASSTVPRALLDSRKEVAANASLATGSLVFSLQLLAGGHLAAGTDDNGVQLFANATVARALLDSRKEVAANASLATASLICSLQVLADGHLAAGTRSDGVQLFATQAQPLRAGQLPSSRSRGRHPLPLG
jgi:hypothetical protein